MTSATPSDEASRCIVRGLELMLLWPAVPILGGAFAAFLFASAGAPQVVVGIVVVAILIAVVTFLLGAFEAIGGLKGLLPLLEGSLRSAAPAHDPAED